MSLHPVPANARPHGCLGPVADLESHLPTEWWRELFDAIYLKTDADMVEDDHVTRAEVDAILNATGLQAHERLLDLCCGQGRHLMELARRGFTRLAGIDRSRFLIRLARRRAQREDHVIAFHEGDARNFRTRGQQYDCVTMMGNSFGYFATEEEDARVLAAVKRALRSGGFFVLDVADGEWLRGHFEPRSWEWIDQHHFVCRERSLSADGTRLVCHEVVVHDERGVLADQFYGERLYTEAALVSLFEEAGFSDIRFHSLIEPASARGQDAGMMGRRLVLSARAPRKLPQRPRRGAPLLKLAVLMGDPRLPDKVKRNGRFNEEDFETVHRLKDALAELPNLDITYHDNHATMARELEERSPDLVFNLCDEGWNNDAFMELHVPAMLDTLRLAYTGGGPACLAMCYDKALVRAVAQSIDIPVPMETFIRNDDQAATIPSVFPAILKPNFGDSSIGITKDAVVHASEELVAALAQLRETVGPGSVLVQEFLPGPEVSVGLVGNPGTGLSALPVLEVDYSNLDSALPRILGYESKWLPGSPYWEQIRYKETTLDADTQRVLIERSARLFERLRCADYARFDFRASPDGEIKLLEVNPNPGWCWDGKMNIMAGCGGLSYSGLLARILEAASERLMIGTEGGAERRPSKHEGDRRDSDRSWAAPTPGRMPAGGALC